MTRVCLSPEPSDWQQGRYRLRDDDSDSDSSSSSDDDDDVYVKVASAEECKYSDDDNDKEDDYPHPVGFSAKAHAAWGSTRFALDPMVTPDLIDEQWQSYNNSNCNREAARQIMQSFPPLEAYMDPTTAPTASLLRYDAHQERKLKLREENDRDMDQITQLLEAASIVDTTKLLALSSSDTKDSPLSMLASTAHNIQQQIQQKMQQDKQRMERDHMEAAKALKLLLKSNQAAAIKILQQEEKQEQEAKEEQDAEDERLRLKQEANAKLAAANAEEAAKMKADAADAAVAAEEKIAAAKAKEAAKTEYIDKAKKLVAQLIQLRASIEPFEKSKALGKRRLNMKKIVRGKVNTLSESADKIQSVAFEVGKAIAEARAEDEELKKQLQAGNTQIAPEMTRGKRYLVDLLASSIMVRVQAEGFNGLRGDGFPIANMLALVSLENKELIPILSAHIYTVCPTAIPKLPSPSTDASEDALMKSLGMSKDKKGEYETFARFLTRTEGIISLVANIMASNPPNHQLLGGNRGAVEWLSRFLKILPAAPQSPLPLLTAPVLDAFLTGAGHMLANVHPEYFKQLLGKITNEIVDRLDEGPIGQPSAIRLRKTVKDGFDGFKNKIPSKALAELYCGANGTGGHASSGASFQPSSGVGGAMKSQSVAPDPFGGGGNSSASAVPNPFGGGGAAASAVPNPFGGGGGATTSSNNDPFGKPPTQNPFGGSAASSSNPFGQQSGGMGGGMQADQGAQTSSTFGASTFGSNNNNPSPFGASQPSNGPSQFGSSGGNVSNPSPFGGGGAGAPAPFGQPAGHPSPFGGPPAQGQPTPFGQPASNPSPFGGVGAGAPAPFGQPASNPSPFGGPTAPGHPSPFGQPAPANNPSPFGGGGGGAGAPSPFGQQGNNPSPFGGGMGGTPFGGPQQGNPFGGGNQTTPFGGKQQQGGRGGGGGGRGNGGRGNGGRGGSKPPCRFFAKGQCRYGNDCRFSHGM